MDRITMRPYSAKDRRDFSDMLYDYFNNDLDEPLSRERLTTVAARIEYETGLYPMYLNIIENGDRPVGFVIFQIDTPDNPWGLKPGWGFIREMYIHRQYRRRGLGSAVVDEVCKYLLAAGVQRLYLTADSPDAIAFWQSLGFADSGEVCEKNGLKIYSK